MTAKNLKKAVVSLANVAKEAGVSKMTVSRVLRNDSGFSEGTREKVNQAVKKLGYVNNKLAVAFNSTTKSTLIGIAVPSISGELFSEILEGIESKLSAIGYQAIVGAIGYEEKAEEEWLRTILQWRPSGLILTTRQRTDEVNTLLTSHDIPVVEIWGLDNKPQSMCVGFNHFDAGYSMGCHVARKHHQKIGYIGTRMDAFTLGEQRLEGFKRGLAEYDLNLSYEVFLNDHSSFYSGFYATEHMLSAHQDIDLIYYLDDNMAVGGMMFCQQKGLSIPGDIGIAGFGSMSIDAVLPVKLTTTRAFRRRIGKLAAAKLLTKITGEKTEYVSDDDVIDVGFELIEGHTV